MPSIIRSRRSSSQPSLDPRAIPLRNTIGSNNTITNRHHAMSILSNIRFMRHQHNRISLSMQLIEQPHDFVTSPRIKIPSRFVRQNDAWTIHQRSRNRHPLPLTARKLIRFMHHPSPQIHRLEHFLRTSRPLRRRRSVIDQRKLHIMQRSRSSQQIERLKHKPNLLVANPRQLIVIELRNVMSIQPVLALRRRIQAADQVHQRRFPRTRWSHDRNILVMLDPQVHTTQRMHLLIAHLVRFPKVGGDNHLTCYRTISIRVDYSSIDSRNSGHQFLRSFVARSWVFPRQRCRPSQSSHSLETATFDKDPSQSRRPGSIHQ